MKKLFLIMVALLALQMQAQTYTEWSTTNALPTEAGTYRLTTDVTLSAAWVVPTGTTVLDLNDHIVRLEMESGTDHVISVGKNITLTIEDNAATKTTRYWEEHATYHYWLNPSTTDNGLGLTTVGGCITGGTGKTEAESNWGGKSPLGRGGTGMNRYVGYVGGGIFNLGVLQLVGGNVVGNILNRAHSVYGSGIFNAGSLEIGKNSCVLGNGIYMVVDFSTSSYGAGVFNAYCAMSFVNHGSISFNYGFGELTEFPNTVAILGGGVCSFSNFSNDGIISDNRIECPSWNDVSGAGVYMATYEDKEISFVNEGTITDNISSSTDHAQGGGVFMLTYSGSGKFTNSGSISSNKCLAGEGAEGGAGGGVFFGNSAANKSTFTNSGKISGNICSSTSSSHATSGGGVYLYSPSGEIMATNTVEGEISDNVLNVPNYIARGAGVFCSTNLTFINNGKIVGNIANQNSNGQQTQGGGVFCNKTNFTNHGTIQNNSSVMGGGLHLAANSVLTNDGVIAGNTASSHGGGICVGGNGTFSLLSGSQIKNNKCLGTNDSGLLDATYGGYGGGLFVNGTGLTIDGGTTGDGIVITGNTALNGGGAMYINNKVVNIKGKVNISGNTLTDTGATPSNVLLYTAGETCKVNVNGALDTTTPIGVGIRQANTTDIGFTPICGVVTTGYGTNVSTTELQHFKLDKELYEGTLFDIYKNSDHEVEIGLPVNDYEQNGERLTKYNGEPISVKIGRTLNSGYYNTLALPFEVDNDLLKKRFGDGVVLKELTGSTYNGATLTLKFETRTAIEAGKPYLIMVPETVIQPTFTAMEIKNTLSNTETEFIDFKPVFSPTHLENDNRNILFLMAGNKMSWPSSAAYTMDFQGLRSYFQLKGAAQVSQAPKLLLDFGDGEVTAIDSILAPEDNESGYYTMDGCRLDSKPTAKGVYIVNGKKMVIK